ncbi:MAG TPA: HAD family hydrolase [Phycisphaeraceae bacterium]
MLRAILFDLGDTLIQFGRVDRASLFRRATARTYRLWAQRQRRMPSFRRYYLHQWSAIHWAFFKTVLYRREVDAMRLIRRACRKLWLTAPEAFFKELVWAWYEPLAQVARLEPGTHQTLDRLARSGYRLGIVSNTFVPGFVLDRHLAQLDLLRYFPYRIYSCDVGYRKPDRRIFDRAVQAIGAAASQCVFVGDLLDADIHGAHQAGLTPVWKRPPPLRDADDAPPPPQGTPIIDQLVDLPEVIDHLKRQAMIRALAACRRAG